MNQNIHKTDLITRKTALSDNVVAFCRYLRSKGFSIGPLEEADALQALEVLEAFQSADNFQMTLRAVLTKSFQQQRQFDELYEAYWKEVNRAVDSKIKDGPKEKSPNKQSKKNKPPSLQALKNWLYGNQSNEVTEVATYSAVEAMTQKDFSGFTEDELHEIIQIIHRIAKELATKFTRRKIAAKSPGTFNLRRTLRLNMRRGGEIVDLGFVRPQKRKMKIVMLCDVSKSMDLYSRFLVQFMYGFHQVYSQTETFVFSTSLHRITPQLYQKNYSEALDQLADAVPNWSGGTKIGASFQAFLEKYGQRLLDKRTIVLIMSDGWDTGEIEILEESMYQIHRKAAKVVWLNPLAGNPKFEPDVRGMKAAMPYVDVFAPAYSIESLRKVKWKNSRNTTL